MAGNINLVNVRAVTNLVIAAELSEQLLVLLMEKQHIQAVNLVVVILAQAVILKQTPEVVMIQVEQSAEQHAINQSHVVIQALRTGVRYIVLVMVIAVKTERSNLVIQNAAARDVLLQEEVLPVVVLPVPILAPIGYLILLTPINIQVKQAVAEAIIQNVFQYVEKQFMYVQMEDQSAMTTMFVANMMIELPCVDII